MKLVDMPDDVLEGELKRRRTTRKIQALLNVRGPLQAALDASKYTGLDDSDFSFTLNDEYGVNNIKAIIDGIDETLAKLEPVPALQPDAPEVEL